MMCFVHPALPQPRPTLPTGERWIYEPKLDVWRLQAHKHGSDVSLYSKRGLDLTGRFRRLAKAVATLPAASVILDGEVVALDANGQSDFYALLRGSLDELRLYAFDVLWLDGLDLRQLPLHERKAVLGAQVERAGHPMIRAVAGFDDGRELFTECEKPCLDGVVAKRIDAPYRSGTQCGWVKVKTQAWREANRHRHKLFEPRR